MAGRVGSLNSSFSTRMINKTPNLSQTAATITMNSPESLAILYNSATASQTPEQRLATAELMREIGLKCISFNGIPRTINSLNAFKTSLPESISEKLSTVPTRELTPENINEVRARGRALWDSIYRPFETKLYDKLGAESHPDMPVYILNAHYGALLSDPAGRTTGANLGRLLTSVVGICCLRAQGGVGPQVLSHVFGLRKALEDGTWANDVESEEGAKWLAGEEGNTWILSSVDKIVEAISEGHGSNFASGRPRL